MAGLVALVGLVALAGQARAGLAEYPSPLYLSAAQSSEITATKSYKLVATAGPGTPATPTVTHLAGGSLSGSYQYLYTVVDPLGGETGPSGSVSASPGVFPNGANRQVRINNLPTTGLTVRIYRKRSGRFHLLAELPNNTSSTYVDNNPADPPTATILPQAENQVTMGALGSLPSFPALR